MPRNSFTVPVRRPITTPLSVRAVGLWPAAFASSWALMKVGLVSQRRFLLQRDPSALWISLCSPPESDDSEREGSMASDHRCQLLPIFIAHFEAL